ncbi:hypothetical protein GUG94_09250, partial [Xanthomonas citri pv. citri]|nr:hypothetical protein [Xanthomonas citri pv. citri]
MLAQSPPSILIPTPATAIAPLFDRTYTTESGLMHRSSGLQDTRSTSMKIAGAPISW